MASNLLVCPKCFEIWESESWITAEWVAHDGFTEQDCEFESPRCPECGEYHEDLREFSNGEGCSLTEDEAREELEELVDEWKFEDFLGLLDKHIAEANRQAQIIKAIDKKLGR